MKISYEVENEVYEVASFCYASCCVNANYGADGNYD
jgi:hypothetical protein